KFRVLIVGRANAGKTSILQRVCNTTNSPIVYRRTGIHTEQLAWRAHPSRMKLCSPNHDGYIFHDSRDSRLGSIEELGVVQEFIRQRSGERRLQDRLHAIWFAYPSGHD
ncbi:hypothetical protein EDB84DRAFT_1230362, partial [Lactarius hengduanensis]